MKKERRFTLIYIEDHKGQGESCIASQIPTDQQEAIKIEAIKAAKAIRKSILDHIRHSGRALKLRDYVARMAATGNFSNIEL